MRLKDNQDLKTPFIKEEKTSTKYFVYNTFNVSAKWKNNSKMNQLFQILIRNFQRNVVFYYIVLFFYDIYSSGGNDDDFIDY